MICIKLLKELQRIKERYNIFLIKEPKYRIIMSQNINDKIINHLVAKYILFPALEPCLIDGNVATRKCKGSKYSFDNIKKYMNHLCNEKDAYALKLDISKYFYNIDHNILYNSICKRIKDKDSLNIIKLIIDTTNEEYINENIKLLVKKESEKMLLIGNMNAVKELEKIPLYIVNKGLPLGNVTSQILAIFYMNEIDHYIKEELKYKYYIRYMDDLLIISNDKNKLVKDLILIEKKVNSFELKLNNKCKLYNLRNGIDFVGFNFRCYNSKVIIKYKKSTFISIRKKLRYYKINNYKKYLLSKCSYKGYLLRCNTMCKCKYKNIAIEKYIKRVSLLQKYYNGNVVIYKYDNKYLFVNKNAEILRKVMNYKIYKKCYFVNDVKILKIKDIFRNLNMGFVIVSGNSFNEEIA